MYPLLQIGPFNLSSGGLLLLLAVLFGSWLQRRIALRRGGAALADQSDRCFYPALLGAIVGGRLWYGALNWDLYGKSPELFLALRVGDMAWPGALLGGGLAAYLWCRLRGFDAVVLADSAALALPAAQVIAYSGMLLSGDVLGLPTDLPWGVALLGTLRHPTQIYFALAALATGAALWRLVRTSPPPGVLTSAYLGLQGLTLLLIEALRADSLLLPGSIRSAQVFGLALILVALLRLRGAQAAVAPQEREAAEEGAGEQVMG